MTAAGLLLASAQAATFTLDQTLTDPRPTSFDEFGYNVDIDGTTAIVSATLTDTAGSISGTAYLFDTTTGALLQTLTSPTPGTVDLFGNSVAVSGNLAVVGAYEDDDAGAPGSGAAYVFDVTTGALL